MSNNNVMVSKQCSTLVTFFSWLQHNDTLQNDNLKFNETINKIINDALKSQEIETITKNDKQLIRDIKIFSKLNRLKKFQKDLRNVPAIILSDKCKFVLRWINDDNKLKCIQERRIESCYLRIYP